MELRPLAQFHRYPLLLPSVLAFWVVWLRFLFEYDSFLPCPSFWPVFQSTHFTSFPQRLQRSHKNCTILKATIFRKIMGAQGFLLHSGTLKFGWKFGSRRWWCWLVLWGFYKAFKLKYLLERVQLMTSEKKWVQHALHSICFQSCEKFSKITSHFKHVKHSTVVHLCNFMTVLNFTRSSQ
jgi:hypothetical protein